MQLLQAWKDSLTILRPKNLKLFCLVTLKSILSTYKTLISNFGWLLLSIAIPLCFFTRSAEGIWGLFGVYVVFIWLSYLIFLAARPSITRKDLAYFTGFKWHALWNTLLYFYLIPALMAVFYGLLNFAFFGNIFGPQGAGMSIFVAIFTLPTLAIIFSILMFISFFSLLFLLDSDGSIKSFGMSLVRGIKMFLYNLPFCLLFMIIFAILFGALVLLFGEFMGSSFNTIFIPLLLPVPLCFITNFYIKKLHEQFAVYFKPAGIGG